MTILKISNKKRLVSSQKSNGTWEDLQKRAVCTKKLPFEFSPIIWYDTWFLSMPQIQRNRILRQTGKMYSCSFIFQSELWYNMFNPYYLYDCDWRLYGFYNRFMKKNNWKRRGEGIVLHLYVSLGHIRYYTRLTKTITPHYFFFYKNRS